MNKYYNILIKWTPAKLADGSPIETTYTLPVRFSKAKK